MNTRKIFGYTLFAAFIFIYGFAVGHYHIFPYSLITELRTSSLGSDLSESITTITDGDDTQPARVMNTSLQRLLIKEIDIGLQTGSGPRGAYLAVADSLLYTVTSEGDISAFDLATFQPRPLNGIPKLPMHMDSISHNRVDLSAAHFKALDIYVDTDPPGTHTLYISHHRYEPDENCVSMVVSRISGEPQGNRFNPSDGWDTLFRASPCLMPEDTSGGDTVFRIRQTSGGIISSYRDSLLLLTTGDYGFNSTDNAFPVTLDNSYGKILEINKSTGNASIFALGLRNVQGLYVDSSETIWATDHGPQGGDELNIVTEGSHFGWPLASYGIDYNNKPLPVADSPGRHSGNENSGSGTGSTAFDKPLFSWIQAIAPTQLLKVEGNSFQLWNGDLLITTLRDQSLHRVRTENNDSRVIYDERIDLGYRLRDMTALPDGSLAIMTDDKILIIIKDGGPVYSEISAETRNQLLDELNAY
jgi:hypothetical protein